MASRPVTIVDVAKRAGVSHSTVSRVLNGFPHVSAAARASVEAAAKELGYVANVHARGLAGGQTGVIGVVTLELSSSYVLDVTRGIDEALAAAGLDLMVSTTRERNERERDQVVRLSRGLCDGIIVLIPTGTDLYLEALRDRRYPIVLVDSGETPFASSVTMRNRSGAEAATSYLIELGHRRIGHITGTEGNVAALHRLEGWRSTLEAYGLDRGPELVVSGDFRRDSGRFGAAALLDGADPPTAILAGSDLTAIGVLDELRSRGLRCPEDVSVVGFDDIPEATVAAPALTTIRQPMRAMGRQAVQLLLERSERPDDPTVHMELATELVVRESTAPPRS